MPPQEPGQAGTPPRRYTYRDLVDAWQAEYPGEFDDFNRSDLADAILAEHPELATIVDPSTKGMEVVDGPPDLDLAAARGRAKVQYGPKGRIGHDPRVPLPDPKALRAPGYGDMAAEAGLVAVPSVLGGVIGSGAGPVGTAVGSGAGGAFGEMLREGYQQWAQTRDDGFSVPNIVLQGGINMIPFSQGMRAAGRAVAPELAKRIAAPVARVAGGTLEGAVASATSTATERIVRDEELPTLKELGISAAFGAPFGAAVTGGAEVVTGVRAARTANDPIISQAIDDAFHELRVGADRSAAAQAIYDLATQVGGSNPKMGAEILQRLLREANTYAQADLQQFAAAFVQDFGKRADTLTMDGQISEIEQFLSGLKQRGAVPEILSQVEQVLTDIRTTSSPRPIDQPTDVGWHTPYNAGAWHGPPVDPGQTPAEQRFGQAFESAMGRGDAGPPRMPGTEGDDTLPNEYAWQMYGRPQALPLPPGKTPATLGPPAAILPELQVRGVDSFPAVQTGAVTRDEALMLHWLVEDAAEISFQPGSRMEGMQLQDTMVEATSQEAGRRAAYSPRVAGTPTWQMFEALGISNANGYTRNKVATQIRNLLNGSARRPGKAAQAAVKIARAMADAWDPKTGRFDWSRVSDARLAEVGFHSRRQFQTPATPLGFYVEGQPPDLIDRFLPGERARRLAQSAEAPPFETAFDTSPDEIAEARQVVRDASDEDLRRLYDEMTNYAARTEDLEAPEDFAGPWYEVGPGLIADELERRGLGQYVQKGLEMEGPGTPGRSKIVPDEPPQLEMTLAEATARRERLAAEGRYGSPEYLDALREENRLAEAEAGKAPTLDGGGWTPDEAIAYKNEHADVFNLNDLDVRIVGGAATKGGVRKDADFVVTPLRPMSFEATLGAVEAVVEAIKKPGTHVAFNESGEIPGAWIVNFETIDGKTAEIFVHSGKGPELEQPALIEGVRTEERPTPLLMKEEELFSLTPEPANPPAPRRGVKAPSLFGDDTGAAGKVKDVKMQRAAAQRDVQLTPDDFEDLRQTVQAAGDEEVAGLLVGTPDGQVRHIVLSDNRAPDPSKTFEIGADVVQRAQVFARQRGWEVLGSFHSQPTGSAEPSKRDLKGNVADLPMLILGVRGGSVRDVRIWQPAAAKSAPWLEGQVKIADADVEPATQVPPAIARWMVDRIPKFTGAPGDVPALEKYLGTHKSEFATEPWFVRAQQFLDEGNPRQAWIEVQAATLATQKAARDIANASPMKDDARAALVARIEQATAAGPQDPVGALFALYDGRTTWVEGVGRVVVAPEISPALKGKGVSAGPGGILHPGVADIPLPSEQQVVSMTVDALNDVLRDANAHAILDDPSQTSFTRLNRQIAEQLMLRAPSSWGALKAWRTQMKRKGVSDREINRQIAAHLTKTASESGRFLAALSVWKQRHKHEIRAIEGIKGASGEIDDVMIIGAHGRRIGRLGDLADADTFKDVVQPGRAWDRAMLLNDLTRSERGTFDQFEAASRAFMLSQWATAARNFWSVNARWGVEVFDEVASAIASTTLARPGRALNHLRRAGDLLRYTPILRPDGWVMPWHARQAQWEQIFDTTAYLASLPMGQERRAALSLLQGVPEEANHFLGSTLFGEPSPHAVSKYRILNAISSPRVQNTLTMFNRAQEFTARSGMYVANLRDALRQRDLDPDLIWQLPPADLAAKLGGPDELRRVLNHAVAGALDYTFSGALIKKGFGKDEFGRPKGAFNAALVDLINKFSGIRAGYPWPRFNLSAAPRFIWDHSGVNAVVESINQVLLEQANVGVRRGRFFLGRKAASYEQGAIPEAAEKFKDAQADYGQQLQVVQALSREATIRKRLAARLERRGLTQQAGMERQKLSDLEKVLEREMQAAERAEDRMKGLTAQMGTLQDVVDQAKAVRAPETYAELWGRAGAGVASMLVPAILLRAEQADKGTKWYELRYDIPGLGDTIVDTRPMAPFTQFLFFADVINDMDANTDWAGVWEDREAGMTMSEAIYGRYEGKYTAKTLGQQALNAFLSMSQAAGTTLAVVEEFTALGERGIDTQRLGTATVTAIGNLLARFTIPFAQFKGLTDVVAPSESNARVTSPDQGLGAPLAQPLGNLPFIGAAVIPETYNQLTGQPLDAYLPGLRASLGITLRQWNRVAGEINATGVPGSAVYIRATHDPFLDRLVGFHYSQAVSQYADPLIFANEYYLGLDSPATRRDYLQSTVFPTLKKIALGQAMLDVGWQRMREERETPEQRRRRLRMERLQGLAGAEGISFAEGDASDDVPEPEVDTPDTGDEPTPSSPAGPPASGQGVPQAGISAPRFEEEPADRRPAFDRVLAPAFSG